MSEHASSSIKENIQKKNEVGNFSSRKREILYLMMHNYFQVWL
jgi:hypothetical protein